MPVLRKLERLEEENAALRLDVDRLDWLESKIYGQLHFVNNKELHFCFPAVEHGEMHLREAIDKEMEAEHGD